MVVLFLQPQNLKNFKNLWKTLVVTNILFKFASSNIIKTWGQHDKFCKKTMITLIEKLLKNEAVAVNEVQEFTSFEEARPFIIECGKAARKISQENDSFFLQKAMKEVENAYYEGLHAFGGYNVYIAACHAFGWLQKMHIYSTTGQVTL